MLITLYKSIHKKKNCNNSVQKKLIMKYNIHFFDKITNKTKNTSTKHGVKRTLIASQGKYEFVKINKYIIVLEGEISKTIINVYMKCGNMPLWWRKSFLNIVNNRDYL